MAAAKHRAMTSAEHSEHSASVASRHAASASNTSAGQVAGSDEALSRENAVAHYSRIRRRRTGRAILRGVLIAVLVALIGFGAVAWAYINSINKRLTAGANEDLLTILSERDKPSDPFYMLEGEEYWNYRADTIILARIDPQDVKVTLVSIPRDTYVDMGYNGEAKINSAYSFGGPSYMVEVVQQFAGVPISHYAEIDFDAFVAIVDQIGGIDVTLPVAINDPEYTGLALEAGTHHLNGWDSLMLCRSRHAYDEYVFIIVANIEMTIKTSIVWI